MSISAGQGLSTVSSALQPSTTSETPCFRSTAEVHGRSSFCGCSVCQSITDHRAPTTLSHRLLPVDLNLTLDHLASTVVTFGSS